MMHKAIEAPKKSSVEETKENTKSLPSSATTQENSWQYGKYVGVGAVLFGVGLFAYQQGKKDGHTQAVVEAIKDAREGPDCCIM